MKAMRITPKQAMEHEYFATVREFKQRNSTK